MTPDARNIEFTAPPPAGKLTAEETSDLVRALRSFDPASVDYSLLVPGLRDVRSEKAPRDSAIIRQGEPATAVYLIKSGAAVATRKLSDGSTVRVSELGPGALFGEGAFMQGRPNRVATVTVTEDAELFILSEADFLYLMKVSALFRTAVARNVGKRKRPDAGEPDWLG